MELDPGEISLMSAGACGAFVHGLEDEFMGKANVKLYQEHTLDNTCTCMVKGCQPIICDLWCMRTPFSVIHV